MRKLLLLVPLAAVGVLGLTACNNVDTPPDAVAVHVKGGPIADKDVLGCVPPSSNDREGWIGEDFYLYPSSTRSFRALSGDTEAEPFQIVSQDNAEMRVPMTIAFTLNTDCKRLMEFHQELGNRFGAYMAGGQTTDGWIDMLQFVMGVPADTLLDRVAQEHDWRDLWNDPQTKVAVETALENQLPEMIREQAGGDFFEIQNILVLKPTPVDDNLTRAINAEQSAVARANAQEAQAKAQEASAIAQTRVAKEKAKQKQAEIAGFRLQGMTPEEAVRAYNESQLIAKGQNPYQPTYVVPGIPR